MDPLLICVAPNGARKKTTDHPALPVTAETLGEAAVTCMNAGASMIHLHVRDDEQGHSLDAGRYQEAMDAIRERTEGRIIIQITTEAVGIYSPPEQIKAVQKIQPEAVSIAIRELIPTPDDEKQAKRFFHSLIAEQIMPQYILYSPKEVAYFASLRKRGIIPGKKVSVLFVLGRKQASPEQSKTPEKSWAQPEDLDPFLEMFDKGLKLSETIWSICAFGGNEHNCMRYAAECGGNVRIGFENNHLMRNGEIAQDNAALISQYVSIIRNQPRLIADGAQARRYLRDTLLPLEK